MRGGPGARLRPLPSDGDCDENAKEVLSIAGDRERVRRSCEFDDDDELLLLAADGDSAVGDLDSTDLSTRYAEVR